MPPAVTANGAPAGTVTPVIDSDAAPVFVSVRFCAALVVLTVWAAKVRLPGVSEIPVAAVIPAPLSSAVFGLLAALLATVRLAVCTPDVVGVKVSVMSGSPPAPACPAGCRSRS